MDEYTTLALGLACALLTGAWIALTLLALGVG